jgi:hypothetical protein
MRGLLSWITMRNLVVWNKLCTREVVHCKEKVRILRFKAVLSSPRSGSSGQFWDLRIRRLRCPPQSSLLSCVGVLDWNNWMDKSLSGAIIAFTIPFGQGKFFLKHIVFPIAVWMISWLSWAFRELRSYSLSDPCFSLICLDLLMLFRPNRSVIAWNPEWLN